MPEVQQPSYVETQSPPSSYAIAAAIDGEPGAWGRVLTVTLARAFIIFPGLYLGGIRGKHLLTGSLAASSTITAMLFGMYAAKKGGLAGGRAPSRFSGYV